MYHLERIAYFFKNKSLVNYYHVILRIKDNKF